MTLKDHTSGIFGFLGRVINSDLVEAYRNALRAFPSDLVAKVPPKQIDLAVPFKIEERSTKKPG